MIILQTRTIRLDEFTTTNNNKCMVGQFCYNYFGGRSDLVNLQINQNLNQLNLI